MDVYTRNTAFKLFSKVVVVESTQKSPLPRNRTRNVYTYNDSECIEIALDHQIVVDAIKSDYFPQTALDGGIYVQNRTLDALMIVAEQWPFIEAQEKHPSLRTLIANAHCQTGTSDWHFNSDATYATPKKDDDDDDSAKLSKDIPSHLTVARIKTDFDKDKKTYLLFQNDDYAGMYASGHPGCVQYRIPNYYSPGIVECPTATDTWGLDVKDIYIVHWKPALMPILQVLTSKPTLKQSVGKYIAKTVPGAYYLSVLGSVGLSICTRSLFSIVGSLKGYINKMDNNKSTEDKCASGEKEI